MHNLTTMNLSTSSVHRYKIKGRHRLVMLIRQTCILSINTILLHNIGQKISLGIQVIGEILLKSVRTSRQLRKQMARCVVRTTRESTEPKNSKTAMDGFLHGLNQCRQKLHQFDRLDVMGKLVDRPLCKHSH
ncbi:hypothetical protein Tco_1069413 [Tanacetum coccineum]|uniref:Uncharacterized protein n=1 Tax=Tanacetum coccineum TaxID=301880 RepID=A0ABQ5HIM3_9ASTR